MTLPSIPVFWCSEQVGVMTDVQMDMWYLDGQFLPAETALAVEFQRVARSLPIDDWFGNPPPPETWVWVGVDINKPTHRVLSLTDRGLLLRLVTSVEGNW